MNNLMISEHYLLLCLAAGLGAAFWAHRASQLQGFQRAQSLRYGATTVELLGIVLSIVWAWTVFPYKTMAIVFVVGWIAATMLRATTLDHTVRSLRQGALANGLTSVALWAILFGMLYGSGLFFALNDSTDAAQQRVESSLPAQALDGEISLTLERLRGLSSYSDSDQAYAQNAQREALQQQLAVQQEKLAGCPRNYFTKCINPARAEISRLQGELAQFSGGYADQYQAYTGMQAHLVQLQKQRAALTANGEGVASAWKAEDVFLSELLSITPEQANRIKWIIATGLFDLIGLLARILAALIPVTLAEIGMQAFRRAFDAAQRVSTDSHAAYQFAEKAKLDAVLQAKQTGAARDDDEGSGSKRWFSRNAMAFAPKPELEPTHRVASSPMEALLGGHAFSQCDVSQSDNSQCDISQSDNSQCDVSQSDAKPKKGLHTLACLHCGTEFKQRTVWQKFCSTDCRNTHNGYVPRKRKSS